MQDGVKYRSARLSVAFDRASHSGLLFKLKSLVLVALCCPFVEVFLSDRGHRDVVDGAASEWIPIISGMPQGSVLGPPLFIIYTSKMSEIVENRLFAYADDSTLLAADRRPADRPAVAGSLTGTWTGFRSGAITGE